MNKLIVLVGPSGAGKTTLARAMAKQLPLTLALEQHDERPFQALFKKDARFALANQIDYLLLRAEQEKELRKASLPALMDGGLDLDFHGFTKLFHASGFLSRDEYALCERFYFFTRGLLPPPDMVIALSASEKTIRERLALRNRINIASEKDADFLERHTNQWLDSLPQRSILRLDVSTENIEYKESMQLIKKRIQEL